MDSNWASENLQVIRTIMERAAVYRRALAPIMVVAGLIGLAGAALPCFTAISSNRSFALFWMTVSMLALLASLLLVRRQALKDQEPFWSPPTRRVSRALAPAFLMGLAVGLLFVIFGDRWIEAAWLLSGVWICCYGCGLHAAGFFMVRGIRLFAWIFVAGGCAWIFAALWLPSWRTFAAAHEVMGSAFGLVHLAYGVYLYFTENSRNPA
jgi:hypothetical protein